MSEEIVKCPFCGYVYRTDLEKTFEDGKTTVLRDIGLEYINQPSSHCRVDLTCPNCDMEFKWPQK